MSAYPDERGGGVVRGSRDPVRRDPRWSPGPDLPGVRAARRHRVVPSRLEGPADLVLEIASARDPGLDVRDKGGAAALGHRCHRQVLGAL